MFAVIKTGGKQYRVAPGDVLTVEKLNGINGDMIDFTDVLMVSDGKSVKLGVPLVSGAVVKSRIINQERGDKVLIFKKIRRHNYRRKNGHRQYLTAIQILEITAQGMSGKAEKLVQPKPIVSLSDALAQKTQKTKVAKSKAEGKSLVKKETASKKASEKKIAETKEKSVVAKPVKTAQAETKQETTKKPAVKAKKPTAEKSLKE